MFYSFKMNKICRICLGEGVLTSIFTRNYGCVSLADMIEHCSNIKIGRDDGLPDQLCSNCVYKLGIAYHFKQTSESADVRLRQYLGLNVPSKNIEVGVMTDPIITNIVTVVRKCSCKKLQKKTIHSNYRRKAESEKLKRGPKPKPKTKYSCCQCNKEFRCQAQLDMHERTHTGDKPFLCMYCPRRFSQKHNLTIHLRTHTGEKPFQCEICSKTFSAQGNLQTHIKIHTGQRDHVCALCSKGFITSSELTRHMCKHRGVKDHKCNICGSAFVQMRDLKLHQQKKHQIQPQKNISNDDILNKNEEIDIEEVSKSAPTVPLKDISQYQHLTNVTGNLGPLVSYTGDPREIKSIYNHQESFQHNVTCSLCGEVFDYLSLLVQHYLNSHKDHQPIHDHHTTQ